MTVGLVTFAAAALLLVALGIPLARRRVAPNGLYGYRTRATLADEQLWYAVNARTGVEMIALGGVLAVVVGAAAAGLMSEMLFATVATGLLLLGVVLSALRGHLFVRRWLRGGSGEGSKLL